MIDKILPMLSSIRFWYCIIFAVCYYLGKTEQLNEIITSALQLFSAFGIAIRTIDSTADKFSK